jgi:nicotinate phosphoribosyltransferase
MIDEPCVQGIDDTDLYKLSVQKAYVDYCPGVPAVFEFVDRRPHNLYNDYFLGALKEQIKYIGTLKTDPETISFLGENTPWLGRSYLEYLRNFRPNPDLVDAKVDDGKLRIRVSGPIEEASPWEIWLMSTISELNFRLIQTDWSHDGQIDQFHKKAKLLQHLLWSEFGTRRRRDWWTQLNAIREMHDKPGFVGTSNVRLARMFGVKACGTYPHELTQAISALDSLRHANRYTMSLWQSLFGSRLGTALPDTFGTDAFLGDFNHTFAKLFDSVRHDSGDPYVFADKIVGHYRKLGIDPITKTIIFSDNLNPQICLQIASVLKGKIRTAFGIGTNITNSYEGSPALNMVIKLTRCDNIPVVKLSDDPGKAIGDPDAIRVAKWTFFGNPL